MHAPHLRLQLEPLEASARRIGDLRSNELEPALRDLATLNRRLDDAWSGQARAAFDTAFADTLARLALAGPDLARVQVCLQIVVVDYRELERQLVAAIHGDEARPHDNGASRRPGGGVSGLGGGGAGLSATASAGTIPLAALTGNPFEDLWSWIMSWFGAGSAPTTPTPTPSALSSGQPLSNGFPGWGTPQPTAPPWAYPVMCTDAASTDPNHPQPFINNATCNALLTQLDPIYAAQLHQQIQDGEVALEIMTVGGVVTLVARDVATGERRPIAATAEQGDNDEQSDTSGSAGAGGSGPGQLPDPDRVVETIEEQIKRVGQQRFDDLAADPATGRLRPEEAQVALDLEARGVVAGPVTRPASNADFVDALGQEWDIKQFNSRAPIKNGGFVLETSVGQIQTELLSGERVVIDTRNMSREHMNQLWDRLVELGVNHDIVWWP